MKQLQSIKDTKKEIIETYQKYDWHFFLKKHTNITNKAELQLNITDGCVHIYYDTRQRKIIYKDISNNNTSYFESKQAQSHIKPIDNYTMNDAIIRIEENRRLYRNFYNELNGVDAYEHMYYNYETYMNCYGLETDSDTE